MKYYKDDTEITKEQAYKLIKDFVRFKFDQDFGDSAIDGMFNHHKWNSIEIIDQYTGKTHCIYSRFFSSENHLIDSPNKQLSLF